MNRRRLPSRNEAGTSDERGTDLATRRPEKNARRMDREARRSSVFALFEEIPQNPTHHQDGDAEGKKESDFCG